MALIFSPITEDVLEGPFQPAPKSVFMMLQLGPPRSQLETEMDATVASVLRMKKFDAVYATSVPGNKDYLDKIIQLIRGCGFGVAIFSEVTPARTMGNIFFEVALCNLFGKPVLLVKSEDAEVPSDLVRSEWVGYRDGDRSRLREDVERAIDRINAMGDYYTKLGDLALEAEEGDIELAFERYKQAFLITGKKATKSKIHAILTKLKSPALDEAVLHASRKRLRKGVEEFATTRTIDRWSGRCGSRKPPAAFSMLALR
jgi:hypothetical protein